ncbi:hypothetical protein [Desulfosporosinus sp. I2]|uniref:hypothetical protein n=1 Tax=Desulfosporosinus sp. I2 TaxID=1617025 RepID=UPI0012E0AC94|nr:hypothetical protein [Desulfosporosinus sp. I2]
MAALRTSVSQGEDVVEILKKILKRYKSLPLSDERGGPQIYVLGGFAILLLMGLFTTFGYAYKIQIMASNLNYGTKIAATTAFGSHTIPNTGNNGVQISNANALQQEFRDILQDQMKDWPQSTYTLQSIQVYGESDRGSSPPTGFSQPIPGTSAYIKMDFNIEVNPGFLPMNTRWTIPLYVMVSTNSYESATGAWNLVR